MPSFSLRYVPCGTTHDFTAIAVTEELAYTQPYNTFYEILRGDSVVDFAARQAAWHIADPTSFWCYVVDEETGVVAGAMGWNLNEKCPDWKTIGLKADWIPEGDLRELSDIVLAEFFHGRAVYIKTPHLLISYCFTHPDYRRQGVGKMMIECGLKIADAQGLVTWVESTDVGHKFYEKMGFENEGPLRLETGVRNWKEQEVVEEITGLKLPMFLPRFGWILCRPPKQEISTKSGDENAVEEKDKLFLQPEC